MNLNAIIAILELKGIITREEGEKLVEHLANKPQSTMLADAVEQIKELVDTVETAGNKILEQVKPAIASAKEEIEHVAEDAKNEVTKTALEAATEVKAEVKKDLANAVETKPAASDKKVTDAPKKK